MDVEAFRDKAAAWIAAAHDPRWERPYTDLTYLPQIELLNTLRGAGYETYIVTGGGQDFVRAYAERVYGIPPEKVVGSTAASAMSDSGGRTPRSSSRSRSLSSTTTTPASPRASI